MNETWYYLGAYLEVQTKMHTRVTTSRECENGHAVEGTPFCPICGRAAEEVDLEIPSFPLFVDDVIGEQWEDRLSHLNSPSQPQGILRLIDNSNRVGEWIKLSRYQSSDSKKFPTTAEIEAMKAELRDECRDVIAAITESPDVVSVTVKAGYVLDQEF